MKNCKQCHEPIGKDKRKDSVFCSSSCKAKYHEQNGENKNFSGDLEGIKPESKIQLKQPNNLPEIKSIQESEELEPFKNILGGDNPPVETPKAIMRLNMPLPPQQVTKQISVPNPKYNDIKMKLDEIRGLIQNNVNTLKWLNEQIQLEISRDGSGIVITSGVTGAALGYLITGESSPKKKSTESKENTKKIFGSVALGLLGLFIGNIVNSEAEPIREKQKAENIRKHKQQILIHENYLNKLRPLEKELSIELAKHSQNIWQQQTSLNPAYTETLKQNSLIKMEAPSLNGLILNFENFKKQSTQSKNPLETNKILSAKNMATQQIPLLDFKDKWFDFIGQPQTNFFMVVHGMSGEGKTHFTIQFAKYLAERFGNVLYVSGEEGFAPTMQKKIQDMGAMVPKLYVGDFRTGTELLNEVPNKYHFIIIDSTNNMDIQPELMKAIRQRFKRSGFIAVCQSTKDDKIRGSYQIVHDSDITVKVNNGIAVTTKNRFKEKGTAFDIFAAYNKPHTKVNRKKPDDELGEDFRNTV